jgi:hypothetical protein
VSAGRGPQRVQPVGDVVQVVVEQVGVAVQGHGRGGGPEPPLHRLDIGGGLDRQQGRGVPQFVLLMVKASEVCSSAMGSRS